MTLHESKHSGYTELGRLPQPFVGGEAQPGAPSPATGPSRPPTGPGAPSNPGLPIGPGGYPPPSQMPPPVSAPPPPPVPDIFGPAPAPLPQAAPQAGPRRPDRALYKHADLGPLRSDREAGSLDEDCFDQLARIAEPENWAGPASAKHDPTWVLREYVEWTFERLFQQRQVVTSPDSLHCVFNTGLATPQQETVYGRFVPNRNPDAQPWQFAGWYPESDPMLLDHFPQLPELASYHSSPADLVYDVRRKLSVSPKGLLDSQENLTALPAALRSNPYQAILVLEGAVRRAEARVRRNHRTAVPCWDPATERVRLLLPLPLTNPGTVDVALVVTPDGDQAYRATMILPLDIAYARARQLAKPDNWLG